MTSAVTRIDLRVLKYGGPDYKAGRRHVLARCENLGTAATVGPMTILESLPSGISFSRRPGLAWSCRGSADSVICIRGAVIRPVRHSAGH